MTESRFGLKRASGWFAAGEQVRQAAVLLSDCAFKLFVWICLNAERSSGRFHYMCADLARVLQKTESDIRAGLNELQQGGFCRFTADQIEIADRFWPYQRSASPPVFDDAALYIDSVRRLFLSHICVRSAFSPADERLASEWRRRGIPLECVERAIHLGVARKYAALINNGAGAPITTLHYFKHLVEQVEQAHASPDYWRHIAVRCAQFELRWRALNSSAPTRSAALVETK